MKRSPERWGLRIAALALILLISPSAWAAERQNRGEQSRRPALQETMQQPVAEGDFSDDPLLSEESGRISDPLKGWNLVWFKANDRLYYYLLKPTSKGYKVLFPEPVRYGVKNFLVNLEMPIRFFNSLFQGHPRDAGQELARFAVNSTIGVLGILDPATHWLEMDFHARDMDQTLAKAGADTGAYLVLPVMGPSSVRGVFGKVSDMVMDPATYIPGVGIVEQINTISLGEFHYEEVVEASIDPYVAVRSGYVQFREKKARED